MESLEILNGKLSPKYDKYNDIYTVSISSDINELEIKYSTNENEMVNIYGNTNLQEGKNKVIIAFTNSKQEVEYITLIVNKERTNTVFNYSEFDTKIEVENKNVPVYIPGLIGITCFILIILLYLFMFKKRNSLK